MLQNSNKMLHKFSRFATLALTVGILLISNIAKAQNISQTKKSGSESVTIKVLPAEKFTGSDAMMTWDGGAKPELLKSKIKPNHHLVVFIKMDGKPVENATVEIRYKKVSSKKSMWKELPVVRMHITGKSLGTTHYGNNVRLSPGKYEARVTVDKKTSFIFHFNLSK